MLLRSKMRSPSYCPAVSAAVISMGYRQRRDRSRYWCDRKGRLASERIRVNFPASRTTRQHRIQAMMQACLGVRSRVHGSRSRFCSASFHRYSPSARRDSGAGQFSRFGVSSLETSVLPGFKVFGSEIATHEQRLHSANGRNCIVVTRGGRRICGRLVDDLNISQIHLGGNRLGD